MKVIWSYCSFGGKNLPTKFTLKMARLSLLSMRNFGDPTYKTVLYTDQQSAPMFSNLPYDEVIVTTFNHEKETRYWNLAKMWVYSQQQEPFLHVDIDTCFLQGFRIPTEGNVITEKMRDISEEPNISIHADRTLPTTSEIVCSGLIGGNCYGSLFKEHYKLAKNEVAKVGIGETVKYESLYSLEEYLMTQHIIRRGLTIQSLQQGSFLHFWCRRDSGITKQEIYEAVINELLLFNENYDLELRRCGGGSVTV